MADKTLPLDATGKLQLKLVDDGDGTYSISAAAQIFGSDGTDLIPVKVGADGSLYVGGITVESVTATNVGISQTEGENVVEDRALAALIGEVQASPTANTLLARLKSLEDKIDAITDGTSPAVTQLSGSYLAEATPFSLTQDSAANTAQTLSIAAVAGKTHYITFFEVVLSGAACTTECVVTIKDGVETILKEIIGVNSLRGTRIGMTLAYPITGSVGEAVSIAVGAAGADAVTTINVGGYTM